MKSKVLTLSVFLWLFTGLYVPISTFGCLSSWSLLRDLVIMTPGTDWIQVGSFLMASMVSWNVLWALVEGLS